MSIAFMTLSPSERSFRRSLAIALLQEAHVEESEQLVDLAAAVARAEKDGNERTLDSLTGRWFSALELMDQLESEGLDRLGVVFSRRRGYSEGEIVQFEAFVAAYRHAISEGADEAEVTYALGVADGQLDLPEPLLLLRRLHLPSIHCK